MPVWTIETGINFVRSLQDVSRKYGYHVALGGGVLNRGYSEHDLDVYFLPMGGFDIAKSDRNPQGLIALLSETLGNPQLLGKEYEGSVPLYKAAVKFNRNAVERIDCFFF